MPVEGSSLSYTPEWVKFWISDIENVLGFGLWGIEVPVISFVFSVLMLVFFLYSLVKVAIPWYKIRKELRDAYDFLAEKKPSKHEPISNEAFNEIDEFLYKQPSLEYPWHEFRETITQIDGKFRNSVQSESFFNMPIIHKKMPIWHAAVPGMLTAAGLLGTFIALLFGLTALHVDPATGQVEGLSDFINALSGKFLSSITGLTLAIAFTAIEKKGFSGVDKHLYNLQHIINRIFPRLTSEDILHKILQESKGQTSAMNVLASDLAGQIQTSMQQNINPEIQKMIEAIENLNRTSERLEALNTESLSKTLEALEGIKSQSSDAIVEAMQGMMDEFRQTLTGTASNELNELSRSMADAAKFLQTMDEKNKLMEDRMGQILSQLSEGLASQQSQFGSHSQELAESMANLIAKMEASSNQSVEALQSRIEEMLEQNTGWANQMQSDMQSMAQAMAKTSEQMAQTIQEAASSQSNHMKETQKSLNSQQQELVHGLQNEMSTLVGNVSQQLLEREENVQKLFNQAVESQKALVSQLGEGSKQLKEVFDQYQVTLSSNKALLSEAKPIVDQLQGVSGQLGNGLDGIKESNSQMQKTLNENRNFIEDYQRLINDLKALQEKQKDIYAVLDERLGSILEEINNNMIKYNETTRDGLQKTIGEWDNELRNSVKLLSAPVSELGESFDLLTDMLDKKLQRS